ncbi:MAG: type II toxin-antitoxin system RelE/ParE family toxin [Mariprofundaceae bacterium]|nr:type II toxin-antitoxin system RelE/ParE family toxin [Mariprofundaceae bacterium]
MSDEKNYLLTLNAEADLRKVKQWSLSHWRKELTQEYFVDLNNAAEYVATHHESLCDREDLTGGTGLSIHPVREHYLVYMPVDKHMVIIVAVIRQVRNIPEILTKSVFMIGREVQEIKKKLKLP